MIKKISISKSEIEALPFSNYEEFSTLHGKGWAYSYVYHFTEVRDVFLALRLYGDFTSLAKFYEFCIKLNLPYTSTQWNSRRLLENLNALKNFGLISNTYKVINLSTFNSIIGESLTKQDVLVFKRIFFSYTKFCEIHKWFLDDNTLPDDPNLIEKKLITNSKVIYFFSRNSRFIDTLFFELSDKPKLYSILDSNGNAHEDMIRFWDVYVKWALTLKLIEKINLKNIGVNIIEINKSLNCLYYIQEPNNIFDLYEYVKLNYKSTYINVSNLIYKVAVEKRLSVEETQKIVVESCLSHPQLLRFQRTSEAFIENKDKSLMPKVNGSFVSHILVL